MKPKSLKGLKPEVDRPPPAPHLKNSRGGPTDPLRKRFSWRKKLRNGTIRITICTKNAEYRAKNEE